MTEVDLLVVGGGMAGLSAGAWAARHGSSVVLVERGDELGGSAKYAGYIWTAPSLEVLQDVNPRGDPRLAERLVGGFEAGLEWVRSLDVQCLPPVDLLGFGRGHQTDMFNYLRTCEKAIRAGAGSEILEGAQVTELVVEDGGVHGARVTSSSGEARELRASSTLLATGGFQGDPDLRSLLIHPRARNIPLRSNPHSRGGGLRLGLAAGGQFGPDGAGFYGHLLPYGVPLDDPTLFAYLTLYYSEHGVLLNLRGERFVDETLGDHLSTLALLEQPEARALLVVDSRARDEWMLGSYVQGVQPVDKFDACYKRGARGAVADDLDDFLHLPEDWGYDGASARDTIATFNRQCRDPALRPARRNDTDPLDRPPFYVIETGPAITFTFGGLRIDADARVLDAENRPIPGLLAAGADAGGMFYQAYAGGLAYALVFGLQAARTALQDGGAPAPG